MFTLYSLVGITCGVDTTAVFVINDVLFLDKIMIYGHVACKAIRQLSRSGIQFQPQRKGSTSKKGCKIYGHTSYLIYFSHFVQERRLTFDRMIFDGVRFRRRVILL